MYMCPHTGAPDILHVCDDDGPVQPGVCAGVLRDIVVIWTHKDRRACVMTDGCAHMISVIIPVYNAASYLRQCVDSVLGQSYGNIEVILVNDGSTDGSGRICGEYALADSRVRVITQSNRGVSAARNAGLDAAQGDWIAFADADDYMLPDALSHMVRAMEGGDDMIVSSSLRLQDGKLYEECVFPDGTYDDSFSAVRHYALWAYLFRREVIEVNGLRFVEELKYSEDRVFIFQYAMASKSLRSLSVPTYVYRINESSACQTHDVMKMAKCQLEAVGYILKLIQHTDNSIHRDKLINESRLILRFTVEKVAINTIGAVPVMNMRRLMKEMSIPFYSSVYEYSKLCALCKMKKIKRRLVGVKLRKEVRLSNTPLIEQL